ncbi:tetratricopeptide repeat protein [Sphingobacterium chuzhouense]|uniref:Tetratricopeptide repeat protein n=1 Tax=Sphingobacterium chuzhouense TaxID=1742264 RepID=A0ABR7XVW7_9SPHI|nr:tetratricopeptide repeat protein [Sphingobacterium chuzhouense]MBD1423199.1 tetratricopeptide repeat protein [Sphingobacterium chuzhouense]
MAHCFSFASFPKLPKTAILFLFVTYFISNTLYAQKAKQDSLEQVLDKRNLSTGERILTLSRLATHHYFNDKREESNKLLDEASQLAEAMEDKQYLARILAIQAMHLCIQGDSTASTMLQSALDNLDENADPGTKGYIWYAKGWMESRNERRTEAVASFIEALRHYDGSSNINDLRVISSIYIELYSIYGHWKDLDNMEKYARLALDNARQSGNPDGLSSALYSLGYTFEDRFRGNNAQEEFRDSAEYYYKQSVSTFLEHEDHMTSRNQLSFNALGLANLYSEFYPLSYNDTAQRYLDIALKEGLKTEHYTVVTGVYGILNEYTQRENRWDDAEHYLNQAVAYQEKNPLPELETKIRLMEALAIVAEKKGDYGAALEYYKQYLTYYQQRFDNGKNGIRKGIGSKI